MSLAATSPARRPDFDSLARIYSTLEWLAFGRGLEAARFCLLEHLGDCRDILLLGDGDGRCLARLAKIAPGARMHSMDASPAMLARAKARLNEPELARATFICADVREWSPPTASYDAVVTLFFLDCFSEAEVKLLVAKLQPALRPGARWLWADFILPARGAARWRAQAWLNVMYAFFRWQTGLQTRVLPPSEEILLANGWRRQEVREFHGIFTRSAVFNQPGCVS